MTLTHDREIAISTGRSRKDTQWQPQITTIGDLWQKLQTPLRGAEKLADYLRLPKGMQDDKKDCGGFVAGRLTGGRRKKNAVQSREIITLDMDNVPAYGTDPLLTRLHDLGWGFCVYSTRKHTPIGPRLRVLIPLDRAVSADEYEAIARKVAELIGIEMCDPSTFEAHRLMYWPSCCADTEYVYKYEDMPLAKADDLLGMYIDWRDMTEWPVVPGTTTTQSLAAKQGDPESKPGVVGAFCRTYDVPAAMERFIPGIYDATEEPGRYTYTGGSTTGGAVLYDDGKFLYSHHATDPCGGKLVNAFDMVRLHLFGDKDDNAPPGAQITQLPSYHMMLERAKDDANVASLLAQERAHEAMAELEAMGLTEGTESPPAPSDATTGPASPDGPELTEEQQLAEVIRKLDKQPRTGQIKSTIDNVRLILENDPRLKGRFALNQFAGRGEILGRLPWTSNDHRRLWSDTDSNGLYWYLEKVYGITGRGNIDAALDIHAAAHAFNEVQDYLGRLVWDHKPRLDSLLIDYLGADDNPYTRAVTRKALVAAVARAMEPGCKFDCMLILCGPQGCGKSTLLDRLSRGWFNDSIRTFEGKEASELLQGVWIVEVAELDAFRRTDVSRIKQFLSLRADRYRAAYGRNVSELPRRCVFFGTCNVKDFLQDTTGNRRFWPVDVCRHKRDAAPWDLDDETIAQIWAEARVRWQMGEPLFLSGEVEKMAQIRQEAHREANTNEGLIIDFVNREVPDDWNMWPIDKRRDYWAGTIHGEDITLVPRTTICVAEIWCELLGGHLRDFHRNDAREINAVLDRMYDWERTEGPRYHGPYKAQRGFVRRKD